MSHESRPSWPRVKLRKELSRVVEQGEPWVYRDALQKGVLPSTGAPTLLLARSGRPLAWGFFDRESPIALRVLDLHPVPADPGGVIDLRLREALRRRLERLDLSSTNAFRWVHGEADRLPGVHVDVYDGAAVIRFDGGGAATFYRSVMADLEKRLPQIAGDESAGRITITRVIERRSRRPTGTRHSDQDPNEAVVVPVRENGLLFLADLIQGQKGGLFLDQRENRNAVAKQAHGKTVLNLFAYTGGFSLYCAAAGATRVDTVDISAPAIEAARENFRRNNMGIDQAGFFAEDAFAFLDRAVAAGQRWDIVISDPPSFAPNQKSLSSGLAAYQRLHRLALAVTAPGGLLCAASCSSHVSRTAFVKTIEQAARETRRPIRVESVHGAGFDHPVAPFFPQGDYLKFVMVRIGTY